MKEEREKVGLKLNIQKIKFIDSGRIISWQMDGEIMETVRDFILGGSKITAGGDCSHEMKRSLLLGRKAITNLDGKGSSSQGYDYSSSHVWLWELAYKEIWIVAFELWCWKRRWEFLGLQGDQTSQ